MADQSHLDTLLQGPIFWNQWRWDNPSIQPDLSGVHIFGRRSVEVARASGEDLSWRTLRDEHLWGANLSGTNFSGTDLSGANLSGTNLFDMVHMHANLSGAKPGGVNSIETNLRGANLSGANLSEANLSGANLSEANLSRANLSEATLIGAKLPEANLTHANLSGAKLTMANLSHSVLIETNLERTTLEDCRIYGISAWNLKLEGAKQQNLNVSASGEPAITVDDLEVAQFIYLLLNNEKIRQVIDTITSKVVLILGRFTSDRKAVLDAIHDELRQRGYLPILFDFEKPAGRDLTETISTLAHMARFIIADITEAKSIPQELQVIVPNLPSVPVQPLLLTAEREYGMFEHFSRYPWVLDTYYYDNVDEVLASIEEKVLSPAETKARELSS